MTKSETRLRAVIELKSLTLLRITEPVVKSLKLQPPIALKN